MLLHVIVEYMGPPMPGIQCISFSAALLQSCKCLQFWFVSIVGACVIHNPISLHTANASIVTVEVGSVEVEGGAGFTYATAENTTTLWPGWFL